MNAPTCCVHELGHHLVSRGGLIMIEIDGIYGGLMMVFMMMNDD